MYIYIVDTVVNQNSSHGKLKLMETISMDLKVQPKLKGCLKSMTMIQRLFNSCLIFPRRKHLIRPGRSSTWRASAAANAGCGEKMVNEFFLLKLYISYC